MMGLKKAKIIMNFILSFLSNQNQWKLSIEDDVSSLRYDEGKLHRCLWSITTKCRISLFIFILQGLFVFIMFCLRREEVRAAVAPYLRRLRCCEVPARPGQKQSYNLPEISVSATSPSNIHTAELDISVSGM